MTRVQKYAAEFLGTAGLLCAVIGSGIMAQNLSAGNNAVALIANTLATVFSLYVLIEVFAPISGAHFNPLVSSVVGFKTQTPLKEVLAYIAVQLLGAILGAWLAHLMFDLPIIQFSTHARTGLGQWVAEAVATAGLIFVIMRAPKGKASTLVASYIGAAYWFTASTSFANPAAVMGRLLTDTFAGIAPSDAPGFLLAEILGGLAGWGLSSMFEAHKQASILSYDLAEEAMKESD